MNHKKVFSHAGLSLFVLVLMIYAVQIVMSVVAAIICPDAMLTTEFSLLAVFISTDVIGFAVYYLMMKMPKNERPQLEKKKMSVKDFVVVFLICMAATYLFNIVSNVITYIIGLIKQSPVVNPLDTVVGDNLVLQVLVLCVAAPIVEELIFRKLLLDRLRPYGDKIAIWVTALAFALLHGNLSQVLYALALGMIFAYVVLRTNDVRYTIALHLIINLLGSTVMPMMVAGGDMVLTAIAGLLIIVFIVGGGILFILNIKRIVLEEGEIKLEKSERFKTIYLNAGMILYLLACLSMFALSLVATA